MSTPSDDITLSRVFFETNRILRANRKHFSILSLLFLLPLYISLIIYLTIYPIGPQLSSTFTETPTIITLPQILYIIVSFVFFICGIGTITYSAFHGYYNRPLALIPTLESLASSFFPLGSTLIVMQLIFSSVGFLVGIVGAVMYIWLGSFTWTVVCIVLMVLLCVLYLQLKWIISYVVVVVESKWGYEPLRRSAYLMKGMRRIALEMIVYIGVLSYLCIYSYYGGTAPTADRLGCWLYFVRMVGASCYMTFIAAYCLTANVVLYIYSMKIHGELALENQPEEYVSLLIDDDGNKSVAAVVHAWYCMTINR